MDAKYINKNYLEESIKDYDNTIVSPIRNVVSNIYYNTADEFNSINNAFNDVNAISDDRYNGLLNIINTLVSGGIGLDLQLNYINSTSPVNYRSASNIIFTVGQIGNIWCATSGKVGTQYYDWDSQTHNLTFSSLAGLITVNANMDNMFARCESANFIGNIIVPNNATTMCCTFERCTNFNQNILIPNSVTNMERTFAYCANLNQNIRLPNSVTWMVDIFHACTNLNQNILIPNTVVALDQDSSAFDWGIFGNCTSLNQSIAIPNSVTSMRWVFQGCTSLNQDDMYIYSQNITDMTNAYLNVQRIGNIHIPTSVPKDTSNFMYNCLVNGKAGYTFAPENIINDLPVDIAQWPPV